MTTENTSICDHVIADASIRRTGQTIIPIRKKRATGKKLLDRLLGDLH